MGWVDYDIYRLKSRRLDITLVIYKLLELLQSKSKTD